VGSPPRRRGRRRWDDGDGGTRGVPSWLLSSRCGAEKLDGVVVNGSLFCPLPSWSDPIPYI
jgi:hypothetical protein